MKKAKIKVLTNWGKGYSQRVKPGEYEIDDPCLFGYGEYLVNNGHAVIVENAVQDMPVEKPDIKKTRGKRRMKKDS